MVLKWRTLIIFSQKICCTFCFHGIFHCKTSKPEKDNLGITKSNSLICLIPNFFSFCFLPSFIHNDTYFYVQWLWYTIFILLTIFLKILFVYLRERVSTNRGNGRERGRSRLRAQSQDWGQMLNSLSHLGAPYCSNNFYFHFINFALKFKSILL